MMQEFIPYPSTLALGYVRGNRNGGTSKLIGQRIQLILRKTPSHFVNHLSQINCFLPCDKVPIVSNCHCEFLSGNWQLTTGNFLSSLPGNWQLTTGNYPQRFHKRNKYHSPNPPRPAQHHPQPINPQPHSASRRHAI